MNVLVKRVNAFTSELSGGNPAGVVLNIPALTDTQMKTITKELNVSETAFVTPGENADFFVRFFSPTREVELCGHATIATFFTMAQENHFTTKNEHLTITQETKAGILPVDIYFRDYTCEKVTMTQGNPVFMDIDLDRSELASSLNISRGDINESLPMQLVSTGLFTLPIYVHSFKVLSDMKPDFSKVKKICQKISAGSIHVFTLETREESSAYHARNFAPLYGINEDPVTGTANGAVSSYLLKNNILKENNLVCEQGDIIGRPGRVYVEIQDDVVKVGGRAVIVETKEFKV